MYYYAYVLDTVGAALDTHVAAMKHIDIETY